MPSFMKKVKILVRHDPVTQIHDAKEKFFKNLFRNYVLAIKSKAFQLDDLGRYLNAKALIEQFRLNAQEILDDPAYSESYDFLGLIYAYLHFFDLWITRLDEKYVGRIDPEEEIDKSAILELTQRFNSDLMLQKDKLVQFNDQLGKAMQSFEYERQKELYQKQKVKEEIAIANALLAKDPTIVQQYLYRHLPVELLPESIESIVFTKYREFIQSQLNDVASKNSSAVVFALGNKYYEQLDHIYRRFGISYSNLRKEIHKEVRNLIDWFTEYQKHHSLQELTDPQELENVQRYLLEYHRLHEIHQIMQVRQDYLNRVELKSKKELKNQVKRQQKELKHQTLVTATDIQIKEKQQKIILDQNKLNFAVEIKQPIKITKEIESPRQQGPEIQVISPKKQDIISPPLEKVSPSKTHQSHSSPKVNPPLQINQGPAPIPIKSTTQTKLISEPSKTTPRLPNISSTEKLPSESKSTIIGKKTVSISTKLTETIKKTEETPPPIIEVKNSIISTPPPKSDKIEAESRIPRTEEKSKVSPSNVADSVKPPVLSDSLNAKVSPNVQSVKPIEPIKEIKESKIIQPEPLSEPIVSSNIPLPSIIQPTDTKIGIEPPAKSDKVGETASISEKERNNLIREQTKAENIKKKQELDGAISQIKENYIQQVQSIENDSTISPEQKEQKIRDLARIRSEKEITLLTSSAEGLQTQLTEEDRLKQEKIRIIEDRQRLLEEQAKKPRLKALSSTEIEQIWEYYFLHRFGHPTSSEFYGNGQAKEVIIRMLQQINKIYDKLNPTQIILENQPGDTRIYYIGDIFGSFESVDILVRYFQSKIFESQATGKPLRIIFLGNYITYNEMDLHTLLYLITFNLLYPNEVLLLRGNHEEITLSEQGGFASRILSKFDQEILNEFYGFFAKLPLAHMIDSNYLKLFATHGGIPINVKDSRRIINIRKVVLDCFKGKITDMDPYSQQLLSNIAINKVWKSKSYKKMNGNPGYEYTEKIFTNFMLKNKIDMMFCGNQVLKSGHQYQFSDQLLCLFSALSYKGDKYPGKIVEIMFPSDPEYPDEENIAPSEEDEEDEDEDEIFYVDEFSDGTPSDQPVNGHQIEENANGNQTNTEVSETQENDQNEQGEEEEISVTVNLLEISKLS